MPSQKESRLDYQRLGTPVPHSLLPPLVGTAESTCPITVAVSMGRRNTKLEIYLQESQKLKSFASVESNGTQPWLGSD